MVPILNLVEFGQLQQMLRGTDKQAYGDSTPALMSFRYTSRLKLPHETSKILHASLHTASKRNSNGPVTTCCGSRVVTRTVT